MLPSFSVPFSVSNSFGSVCSDSPGAPWWLVWELQGELSFSLGFESYGSALVLHLGPVKINCCFSEAPSHFSVFCPDDWPLIPAVRSSRASRQADWGSRSTFTLAPAKSSEGCEIQLLYFSKFTAQHVGLWPVVVLMCRSHTEMCCCIVWVFFVEF